MPPCGWECARDLSGIRKGARHDRPLDQSQISASSTALWCHLVEYLLTRSSQWVVQLISDRGPWGRYPAEREAIWIYYLISISALFVCLNPWSKEIRPIPKIGTTFRYLLESLPISKVEWTLTCRDELGVETLGGVTIDVSSLDQVCGSYP